MGHRIVLAALLAAVLQGTAWAQPQCGEADAQGVRLCRAGLLPAQVAGIAAAQQKPQWCWAASIAMVLAHHGLQVEQEELARQQFGDAADRRASGEDVTRLLSRPWRSTDGTWLGLQAVVGDAHARRYGLRNDAVIAELAAGRPLIMGVSAHMMVLVQVEYQHFTRQEAVRMTGATVIDPAAGVRPLAAAELRPSYVAAVIPQPRP